MEIAILLFPRLTALDAVGPYEVLRSLPGGDLKFVAATPGPQRTDHGALALVADLGLDDVPAPDVIVVPGGPGEVGAREDPRVLDWLRRADATSTWTTSVCTGSLVLGAAGLTARAIQLAIEYDPQPPFDSGSTATASADLVDRLRRGSRFFRE
jgi:putative intracellular protease/amidase